MKINYFQDYQKRVERSKRIIKARRENRKLLKSIIIAIPFTIMFWIALYLFATPHVKADTPLEGQILTIEGLAPIKTTTPTSTPILTNVADCTGSCIEAKILEYFPRSGKTMIAIAKAESGLKMSAVGYNCHYIGDVVYEYDAKGSISKACKKEHRKYAWSVDCHVLQKNYVGYKSCPTDVTLDEHLQEVAALSRVQGLNAWWAYKNGSYLQYMQ